MAIKVTRRQMLAGSAAFAGAVFAGRMVSAQEQRGELAVRVRRDLEVLDPAFRSGLDDANVLRAVFQNLVTFKPNTSEMVMDAAESFEAISDTEFRFKLKPGQMFSDGYGEMTAEDVKFSFERFKVSAPEGKESPYAADWASLKAVEVDDKYTGRIVLDAPRASLMVIAIADASGCIVCKRAVEERGVEHNIRPVGSNAMKVTGFEKQRQVTLERNPEYAGGAAGFEKIAVRFVQDPKTVELALRSGELDFSEIDPTLADSVSGASGLKVDKLPGVANVWLGLNTHKPPFDNVKVREAVRSALDVDQMLVAGYDGKVERANALIMPRVLGHWADAPVHVRDLDKAKALLAEAGQPNGFTARITVLNQPSYTNMALVAQAQLAEVGINLEIDARDGGTFWSAGKGADGEKLDMFIVRFNGKLDPNFLAQWFKSEQVGIWNWQRWASKEFDEILDGAAREMDADKRTAMIVAAQKLMEESAAFVWLTYDVNFVARRDWLKPALMPSGIDWQLHRFQPE
ncbi:ABC transporter substrate-binding protein [Ensifer adhaerens]|uniref:ABC transporter substrate-binding protein n=1 Tax=Ensifer adhaerens TaxID=106592 RepID=UPI00132EFB44|nr:ABC transporter substrate-binding protein [Ensifer adhaerens]QHG74955.1 ABC transporter substrate-binding protein [Ensifer adhaerens]